MSLIWIILVNAIIGMVLYPISIYLILWYADKKYGYDVTKESSEDNLKIIEDFSCLTGVDNRFLLYLTIVVSIIFWEIAIPINVYANISKIKDLHEIRGGDDRKITRIKDVKAYVMKEDIKYAKTMIEVSKSRREADIELLCNVMMEYLDPASDLYEILLKVVEKHYKEIKDYDVFLKDLEKYH